MSKITVEKLRELHLFDKVEENTLKELSQISLIKSYKKGENVFLDKQVVDTIYIVLAGKYSLYKIGEGAQKKVIFILGRDSILNEVIVDNLPASIFCETFEEGELLLINREKLIGLMKQDFALTTNVLNSLALKVRRLYRQMKNTTPIKIEKKLAAKFWKLSRDYGLEVEDGVAINLKMSVTYLADMFGSQRETISRAIKKLEELGLIKFKDKTIIVTDKEKLVKYFKGL
ncbi:Crp/Fnr family transcriptional regulator [Inconstantimicrobium mannanitabidum]|uniref:CRP family transcriptional regulator n=1 Tax=Inconstantimicrobium mannanitabidum TaxID=1604901 RepID=A0ACB5RFX1_9CLOT|nr:Crp/Fnr family transcriptional regulator [Clostridium sp. TW13]GKX67996.1 CRP family transcriptional regulator [Clostridium sp. TW13]